MAQKIFNPDIIVEPEHKDDDKGKTKKVEEKRRPFFTGIREFLSNRFTHMFVGAVIGLFGVYLMIIFISYFSNGAADQSKISALTAMELAKSTDNVNNLGASVGANMADAFMSRGIGVASFIVVFWCIMMGCKIAFSKRRVQFFSYTVVTIISIVTCSMVVGACTLNSEIVFFPLGGNFGKYSNELLIGLIGEIGMVIVNLLLALLWVLVCYKTISMWYRKVYGMLPKRTHFEDTVESEEAEDEKAESYDTKTGGEDSEHMASDDPFETGGTIVVEDKEDVAEEKDDTTIPTKVAAAKNIETGIEVETVVIAKPIEQAEDVALEAFDPTKELSKYKFPTLDLLIERATKLHSVDIEEQEDNKRRITETLNHYNIPIKKIEVCVGPTITLFEIIPADGVRISRIKNLEDDIALSLAALGIRIIAPIPGKGTIGIEVPNKDPQTVSMRSIIGSRKFQKCTMELPMAIGCTIDNSVFIADLVKMPHLLVAGATGQGKSVGLNAIITSLLYKKHPSELKFVLVDPKMVEFSLYSKLEHHYLAKLPGDDDCIITDSNKVIATLNSLVQEMENRYLLLRDAKERNIKDYNAKFIARKLNPEKGHHFMPYIVVIVDEFSDLIMVAGKDVERPIVRIAQKARAVGIHMIIATQRPSTNVITGIIKANFPGRIAFRVTQMVDSRTILDCSGAQQLVGKGDMLFSTGGAMDRIQCAFVDTPEVEAVCDCIGDQIGYESAYELPEYIPDTEDGQGGGSAVSLNDRDSLFEEAAAFIVASDTASTSSLQRRYGIGYNRAGRIMDQMESAGIVGPSQGGKPRKVLIDSVLLQSIIGENN